MFIVDFMFQAKEMKPCFQPIPEASEATNPREAWADELLKTLLYHQGWAHAFNTGSDSKKSITSTIEALENK